jgi:hypothetical protein
MKALHQTQTLHLIKASDFMAIGGSAQSSGEDGPGLVSYFLSLKYMHIDRDRDRDRGYYPEHMRSLMVLFTMMAARAFFPSVCSEDIKGYGDGRRQQERQKQFAVFGTLKWTYTVVRIKDLAGHKADKLSYITYVARSVP